MSHQSEANVTLILRDLRDGAPDAAARLIPVVYGELRALAGHYLAADRPGHTLVPTILADDVFMKLVGKTDISWQSRAHFFAVAAKIMRDLLVDHARAKRTQKRGGDWNRITLSGLPDDRNGGDIDVLDLDEALARLAAIDARQARIVELRFFAGLTAAEVGHVLEVSERTVMYEWRMARAWLRAQLECEDR